MTARSFVTSRVSEALQDGRPAWPHLPDTEIPYEQIGCGVGASRRRAARWTGAPLLFCWNRLGGLFDFGERPESRSVHGGVIDLLGVYHLVEKVGNIAIEDLGNDHVLVFPELQAIRQGGG